MCKRLISVLIILSAAFFLVLPTAQPSSAAAQMPAFSLQDVLTGKTVDSRIFKGKSLLVTFFATWCPPCVQEIPSLIKLHDEYGPKNFSVVALSVDQEVNVVQDLVAKKNITYPVMMADNAVTRGFGGVYGIPTSFLVNSKGTVVKKYAGYVPLSVLVRDLDQILQ